jgi:hypothetical protein
MEHYKDEKTKDMNAVRALRKLIILSTMKAIESQKVFASDALLTNPVQTS